MTECIHVHISITQVQVCLQGFHHRPGKKQFLAALSMTFPAWFDHLLESLHEKFSSNSFCPLVKTSSPLGENLNEAPEGVAKI